MQADIPRSSSPCRSRNQSISRVSRYRWHPPSVRQTRHSHRSPAGRWTPQVPQKPDKSINPRYLVQDDDITLHQKQRRTSVKTFPSPVPYGVEAERSRLTPLPRNRRSEAWREPTHAPRGEPSETCRHDPPATWGIRKLAGQRPFAAGSRIATHSTCDVIGNVSQNDGRDIPAGQERFPGLPREPLCTQSVK